MSRDVQRIALVIGHPDPRGGHFCHALAAAYCEGARREGREVCVLNVVDTPDLHSKEEFEGGVACSTVLAAQQTLQWADHVVFVFPLWLGTMPAKLKSFLEQVLRPGFAFRVGKRPERLLLGRSARIVVTMGMPAFLYRWYFGAHGTRGLRRSILQFCGFAPVAETHIGSVEAPSSADARRRWLDRMREFGALGV